MRLGRDLIYEGLRIDTQNKVTQQKIDLARRAFDAFARRDVDAILELTDPEVQFYAATGELSGEEGSNWDDGSYWGHDGIRRYFEDVERVWAEIDVTPKEFREIAQTAARPRTR